jgi:hypothetical protein
MIQSDAAFFIGKTHKVCQDYAIADSPHSAIRSVWLSDGCSSSPNTDIGARLLSHSAQRWLSNLGCAATAPSMEIEQSLLDNLICDTLRFATRSARRIGTPAGCLDATLLGLVQIRAREPEHDSIAAVLLGDGAVVFGRRDGIREVYRSQYPAGYPYYPVYSANRDRFACWKRVPKNRHAITRTTLLPDGEVGESTTFFPETPHHLLQQPADGLSFAAILSDGIESFQVRIGAETSSTFRSLDYVSIVDELTAFKNLKGEFIHRRLQSFEKECAKRGWHHNDDIAAAAMSFDKE